MERRYHTPTIKERPNINLTQLPAGNNVELVFERSGVPMLIPTFLLHGRQTPEEYQRSTEIDIRARIRKGGYEFLTNNPIQVIFAPGNINPTLYVLDGHHRARYVRPVLGITCIPSRVVDIDTYANAIGRNPHEVAGIMAEQAGRAMRSFSRKNDREIIPATLPPSITNPNELRSYLVSRQSQWFPWNKQYLLRTYETSTVRID